MPPALRTASRGARNTAPSGPRPRRSKQARWVRAPSGAWLSARTLGEKANAPQRIRSTARSDYRFRIRQRPRAEVYQFDDVRRQALDRAAHFLRRDGSDRAENERRSAEGVQEGHRERQAGAGSEDAARGRRELPGSGRSKSVPSAIARDSLPAALRAHALGQNDDRQAGRGVDGCRQRPRRRDEKEGRRAPHGRSQQGVRALSLVNGAGGTARWYFGWLLSFLRFGSRGIWVVF